MNLKYNKIFLNKYKKMINIKKKGNKWFKD